MNRYRFAWFVLVCLPLVHPTPTGAQGEPGVQEAENAVVFLEKSYASPFAPYGKNLILDAQAAGHYFFYNGLTDKVWLRKGGWKLAVPISMIFVVRIFDIPSAPVRTPSFILRPTYVQAFHLRRKPGTFQLWGFGLGITHHSNGQSGCTFLGHTHDPAIDDCVVKDPGLAALFKTNTRDGSFSTNFIPIDVGFRWGRLNKHALVDHQVSLQAKAEIHPLHFIKGGMKRDLASQYGQHMLGLGVEGEKRWQSVGTARVALWQQVRFGKDKADEDWSGQLEASFVFYGAENMGFFGRVHWGNDYYNIRFQDQDVFFQLGFMWDPRRLDQFERQRARQVR